MSSEELRDLLANDHAAVAAGDILRLATASFVHDGPFPFFLCLASLATLGTELEALLG